MATSKFNEMKKKAKKSKSIWSEIRNDHTDESTGFTSIDAWTSPSDDENGKSIALVDADGQVYYKDRRAETDKNAQEIIQETVNDKEEAKQKLVDAVIEKLKEDIAGGDTTVLDDLLMKFVRATNLVQALPEEDWENFPLVPNPNNPNYKKDQYNNPFL